MAKRHDGFSGAQIFIGNGLKNLFQEEGGISKGGKFCKLYKCLKKSFPFLWYPRPINKFLKERTSMNLKGKVLLILLCVMLIFTLASCAKRVQSIAVDKASNVGYSDGELTLPNIVVTYSDGKTYTLSWFFNPLVRIGKKLRSPVGRAILKLPAGFFLS